MQVKQAFVLAGGKGERLMPLTATLPKPLVQVKGKPILEYPIELLKQHGVEEIILSIGYKHEQIEKHFGSGKDFGVKISYSVEESPLGTGGALKMAERLLQERFFMLNGDNIADFNLTRMEEQHSMQGALATIALVEVEDVSSFGVARLDGERITEFVEKPKTEEAPSRFANAGAYVIDKKALEFLPAGFNLIEKTLFPELAQRNQLAAYIHKGKWFTTDTLERLKSAEESIHSEIPEA